MDNDPRKAHKSLFVFTFIGQVPNKIVLVYILRRLTTFYPTPERCNNCHRLKHRTNRCRIKATCSYCISTQHNRTQCTADAPKYMNCYGVHESTSRIRPKFQYEKNVCTLTTEQGISFVEARTQKESEHIRTSTQTTRTRAWKNMPTSSDNPAPIRPDTTSQSQFPRLGLGKSQKTQQSQKTQKH